MPDGLNDVRILSGKRITLGVSGSIAAYKAVGLASSLVQAGAIVDVAMTPNATRFIQPLSFQAITHRPVFADLWAENKGGREVGTHFYKGRAYIFDHIVVSPGMLNGKGGWQCRTETAEIVKHRFTDRNGRPYAFKIPKGNPSLIERGTSDHLPVTVRLSLTRTN